MSEPKSLSVRMVGFDRPGAAFPENVGDFMEFMHRQISEKYRFGMMTDSVLNAATSEIVNMLSLANTVYGLGLEPSFWSVRLNPDPDNHRVDWLVRPASLLHYRIVAEPHPDGGFLVRLPDQGNLMVRGPSEFEAMIGLGRLVGNRSFIGAR